MLNFNDFMDLLDPIEQHRFHQEFEKLRGKDVEETRFDLEVFPELKDYLLGAFVWDSTDQGFDYWREIHDRIVKATTLELHINNN